MLDPPEHGDQLKPGDPGYLDHLAEQLQWLTAELNKLNLRRGAQQFLDDNADGFPEAHAERVWPHLGVQCSFLQCEQDGREWYCGYARFPSPPLVERALEGFVRYVPVHGGVTYYLDGFDGSKVYGFDCNHVYDKDGATPWTTDKSWVMEETQRMVQAIKVAGDYEDMYLQESDPNYRAHVIGRYHDHLREFGIEFDMKSNFLASIAFISGEL